MKTPNYQMVRELTAKVLANCPVEFGEDLPPNLRLRYLRLLNETAAFYQQISKLQKKLSKEAILPPNVKQMLSEMGTSTSPNFRKSGYAFQLMRHSLPMEYLETLDTELQCDYGLALEELMRLQACFERLEVDVRKSGAL